MTTSTEPATPAAGDDSLASILGGRRAAVEASLPTAGFLAGWGLSGGEVAVGAVAAIVVGAALAAWALARGRKPRAVLLGVLAVAVAALIALSTGRAADFFLLQIVGNIASALAWATSIVIRRPLLGVIVGLVLRQRGRWRSDPALARAYRLASWVWVGQYAVRVLVFGTLWLANLPVALGIARLVLTWPLVAACLAVSWWVLRRALPPGHPGMRHPVPAGDQMTGSNRSSSNGVTRER
ncbi:DUF3159 domain-containing protein [Naumannella huperziae]